MTHDARRPSIAPPEISSAHATSLLRRARDAASSRPVQGVVARLAAPDAQRWLESSVADAAARVGCASPRLPVGAQIVGAPLPLSLPLERLLALKATSKADMRAAAGDDARLAATLVYFLAQAAALAHHNSCITSMPREDLDDCLVDLAAAVPRPWRALLSRAAMAPG